MLTTSASITADSFLNAILQAHCIHQTTHTPGNDHHLSGNVQNLKAISSSNNGGDAGYPSIFMDKTIYAIVYDEVFVPPVDPRDYPYLPTITTVHQKEEAFVHNKHELLEYREYGVIVVCCHNQFQKAIHEDYLAKLENTRLGLAKIIPKKHSICQNHNSNVEQ